MQNEIRIVYQHYVPESLIADLQSIEVDRVLNAKIEIKKVDQTRYSNFTGPEISDVIIYIQQHQTEILATGLLLPAAYDLVKTAIIEMWSRLSKLTNKQLRDAGKEVKEPKQITLHLKDKEREVEICFQGDVSSELANRIVDESFKFISSDKAKKAFANPDNIEEQKAKPKIRLLYNKETKSWEPENFGEYRRKMAEYDDLIRKKLSS